jgi:hypothetical protein
MTVMVLERQKFELTCPKCGHEAKRDTEWLLDNPYPFCFCGADLGPARNELLQNIVALEQAASDDYDLITGRASLVEISSCGNGP